MNLETFRRLLTDEGQAALTLAEPLARADADYLRAYQQVARRYDDSLSKAAVETVLLRRRARAKFSRAAAMYFTRDALEQSTAEPIFRYRAERFRPFARIGDFCCGLGSDAIGLSAIGAVTAIDSDELRLEMARANLAAYGQAAEFLHGDLLTMELPTVEAGFFDPDRRPDGQRRLKLNDYQPPLAAMQARLPTDFPFGVKVAPGVPWPDLSSLAAETEFISLDGELKECVLWFGALKTTNRRATVLPGSHTLAATAPAAAAAVQPPGTVLYDPDPAIVRAGLVTNLAEQLAAWQIDPEIAFLSSQQLMETPFARAYRIEAALPFNLKQLRLRLRALRVGRVTILKRGSAVDANDLTRQLKLAGDGHRVVVLTRVAGRPFALIGETVSDASQKRSG